MTEHPEVNRSNSSSVCRGNLGAEPKPAVHRLEIRRASAIIRAIHCGSMRNAIWPGAAARSGAAWRRDDRPIGSIRLAIAIRIIDGAQNCREARAAVHILRWEICPAIKWAQVRREKHAHRPAALPLINCTASM